MLPILIDSSLWRWRAQTWAQPEPHAWSRTRGLTTNPSVLMYSFFQMRLWHSEDTVLAPSCTYFNTAVWHSCSPHQIISALQRLWQSSGVFHTAFVLPRHPCLVQGWFFYVWAGSDFIPIHSSSVISSSMFLQYFLMSNINCTKRHITKPALPHRAFSYIKKSDWSEMNHYFKKICWLFSRWCVREVK